MTHETETTLEDRLEDLLVDVYGEDNVQRQYVFPASNRRVDLMVDLGLKKLVVECESRSSEVIAGMGQALLYAAHDESYVPLIAVADGHSIEDPELGFISRHVEVLEESEIERRLASW